MKQYLSYLNFSDAVTKITQNPRRKARKTVSKEHSHTADAKGFGKNTVTLVTSNYKNALSELLRGPV